MGLFHSYACMQTPLFPFFFNIGIGSKYVFFIIKSTGVCYIQNLLVGVKIIIVTFYITISLHIGEFYSSIKVRCVVYRQFIIQLRGYDLCFLIGICIKSCRLYKVIILIVIIA